MPSLLPELYMEFDRPLNVAIYIDIKATFDCVARIALWKALRSNGVPDILLVVQLIDALHQNTGARVRIGKRLSYYIIIIILIIIITFQCHITSRQFTCL